MTLILVAILILSFVLIATERITNVNKAAVAIFAGTVGWVLYICWGNDFVVSQHDGDYVNFLRTTAASTTSHSGYARAMPRRCCGCWAALPSSFLPTWIM